MAAKTHAMPSQTAATLKRSRKERGANNDDTETTTEMMTNSTENQHAKPKKYGKQENTYQLEPDKDTKFNCSLVENITREVLTETLKDVTYDPITCKELSQDLAAKIMEKVKTLKFQRYKMVAVVSIGSMREKPGVQFGSRCLWNHDTDTFAAVKFTNGSLFAIAMVYGLYYE